jgi:glyoxylase-like metal-dependent hydrolase (beta-lactamase superfamily II)
MQEIAEGVYLESAYPGVKVALVAGGERVLGLDWPLRVEDGRAWLAQMGQFGRPSYVALLDHHPDRVLGARMLDLPLLAHHVTRTIMSSWPDSFKGNTHPRGAACDRIKRVTGVSRAVPTLTFSDRMSLFLNDQVVRFLHRPGPAPGAMWVELAERKVLFIGDAVTVEAPPFLSDADLRVWLEALDELRLHPYREYTLVSARDGVIERQAINAMARFLRKVEVRLRRLLSDGGEGELQGYAEELAADFGAKGAALERDVLRLRVGLQDMLNRLRPEEA